MKSFKLFIHNFNKCYYVLLAIYHNTLELIDDRYEVRKLMATLKELLDGISTGVDTVITNQDEQSKEIAEINQDVDNLHKQLENAGVDQEILNQAQAISDKLGFAKDRAAEATAALKSLNEKTVAAQQEPPVEIPPTEPDEEDEDPNAGTVLEGSGETV